MSRCTAQLLSTVKEEFIPVFPRWQSAQKFDTTWHLGVAVPEDGLRYREAIRNAVQICNAVQIHFVAGKKYINGRNPGIKQSLC